MIASLFSPDDHRPVLEERGVATTQEEFTVLGTGGGVQPVLTSEMMDSLRPHLPFSVQQDNFWLKYCTVPDGSSMRSMLTHVQASARTLLVIETTEGQVFGSFTSSPWRPNGRAYFGNGEAFLWRCNKEIEVFGWTGENRSVQYLENFDSSLRVGNNEKKNRILSEGWGLTISSCLSKGTSEPCLTFDNPSLAKTRTFEIRTVEIWTLTPATKIDQGEQLEQSRKFVFDHGNFPEQ